MHNESDMMRRCRARIPILAALLSPALLAQVAVSGIVFDASGGAVPDATVDLRLSGARRATTKSATDGTFRFNNVAPGRYEITVEFPGFRRYSSTIRTGARSPAPIEIRLNLAVLEQKLDVDDAEIAIRSDTAANLDVVVVDRAALDNLPAFQHDVIGALSRFLDPAAVGSSSPSVVVDGMEGSPVPVSASAIQEVRINQNPYSAEFFRPGRSRMEIITKAGTPDFHGTFNLLLRDYRLDARNTFAAARPPSHWQSFEGSLTGPLGDGKRNSFVVSVNHDREDPQAIIFARTLDGDIRQNAPAPGRDTFISARVSHEIRPGHTIAMRNEFQKESQRGQGVGGFTLPEAGANFFDVQDHVYLHHRITFSPNLINEFSTRIGRHNDYTESVRPFVPRIVVLDAFTGAALRRTSTAPRSTFNSPRRCPGRRASICLRSAATPMTSTGAASTTSRIPGEPSISHHSTTIGWAGRFRSSSNRETAASRRFRKDLGAFVQDNYRLRQNLSLAFGVRADWQDTLGDYNNVAPRAGFAWAPGKGKRVVLRGGAGFFYERSGIRPVADVNLYDGIRLRQIILQNPSYPDPLPAGIPTAAQPMSLARFAPGVRNPYAFQGGAGIETQLDKHRADDQLYVFEGHLPVPLPRRERAAGAIHGSPASGARAGPPV